MMGCSGQAGEERGESEVWGLAGNGACWGLWLMDIIWEEEPELHWGVKPTWVLLATFCLSSPRQQLCLSWTQARPLATRAHAPHSCLGSPLW